MERKSWSIKKSLGNSASHKFKEGPHKRSSLIHAPSFLVSPTHLSGWARPNSNPRRRVLRKQGHEARAERAICTLYFQTEKIHRHQELRSQIIAEGMPACQVFLQRWLPPEEQRQVNYLWLDLLGLFLEKCQRLIPLQLFPCRAPTIATKSANKCKKKKKGRRIVTTAFDRGTFWRLCPCEEHRGETVSWKTKAITSEWFKSQIFNIITISRFSLYAWFIPVSSVKFSTWHVTVLCQDENASNGHSLWRRKKE